MKQALNWTKTLLQLKHFPLSCASSLPVDDEKILVEPACGAALAAVYSGVLKRLQHDGKLAERMAGPVIVVVCGGNNISFGQLQKLKKQLGLSDVGDEAGPA